MTRATPQAWSTRRQFVDGALLTSRDLEGEASRETALRALHVRGAHDTWGVALGLRVWLNTARTRVLVSPGLAYDVHGDTVYLSHAAVLPAPARPPGTWDLAVDLLVRRPPRIDDPAERCACPDRSLAIAERPDWRWSFAGDALYETIVAFADDVHLGRDIPLARFRVGADGKLTGPDISTRRTARTMVRPHVAGGRVIAGSIPTTGNLWHWSAVVDTSAAGFASATPHYVAQLCGHPMLAPSRFATTATTSRAHGLLGPLLSIRNVARRSFTVDVRIASDIDRNFTEAPFDWLAEQPRVLPVDVTWTGFETVRGCTPRLVLPGTDIHGAFEETTPDFPAAGFAAFALIDPTV